MSRKIIVTGGRTYNNWNKVCDVLSLLNPELIIQGGATDADQLAREYADMHHIKRETIHANWTEYGKAAGPMRNKEMILTYPDAIIVAFKGDKGTQNCITTALQYNRLVIEVKE